MDYTQIRRTQIEIIDAVYDALPVNSYAPVSEIAKKSGTTWATTKQYLDLIMHIQKKKKDPWLRVMEVGRRVVYSRGSKAGRPPK